MVRTAFAWLILSMVATAAEAAPLRVCLVSGSEEYDSDRSLAAFEQYLAARYGAAATLVKARGFEDLPGLEALDQCDVALFFTRRLRISGEQLERVRRYCSSGKPIVAVRTASHGFQNWLAFDKEYLGGNYQGHFNVGLTTAATVAPTDKSHPILSGIGTLRSRSSLYRTAPVAADVRVLLFGSTPRSGGPQPLAWVRERDGQRIFYTSLGGQEDFENQTFCRLLAQALFWAAGKPVPRVEPVAPPEHRRADGSIQLKLRTRTAVGDNQWREGTETRSVPVAQTALLLCDAWDEHWCQGASRRCDELAGRIATVVEAARAKGIFVVHAPSETMDFYADSPARQRMVLAKLLPAPASRGKTDPPLPIDASDGGCDTADSFYLAWTRQNKRIRIEPVDGIADQGQQIYSYLAQHGIKNILYAGVHTNMCVLGRSFGIRQMTNWGMECFLIRDLTDTMYDPKDPPHVSHDEGTELVVQHIEKHWCPTLLSKDLLVELR